MSVQIQLRRGTAAAWTGANPTLADGEYGYETDTGKRKIGDGVTAWNSLAYLSGGAGGGVALIAGTQTATSGTVSFADSNGVTFGLSGSTRITATVKTDYQTSGAYLTTADLSANSSNYVRNWKLTGNTAGTTSSAQGTDLWISGGQGITASGNSNTIVLSVGSYITTGALSGDTTKYVQNWKLTGNTAGTTSSAQGTDLWFEGGNSITVSGNSNTIKLSVGAYLTTQSGQAFSAAGGSSAFQTLSFSDNAVGSWTNNAGQIALTNARLSMYATSNTTQSSTGTANISSLIFAGAGVASVGVSGGSVVISVPAGGGGGYSGGVSTDGNTAGSTGTVSNRVVYVGSNNITLSQSTGGASSATVTILGPTLLSAGVSNLGNTAGSTGLVSNRLVYVGSQGITLSQSTGGASSATMTIQGWPFVSSYEPFVPGSSMTTISFNSTGLSYANVFMLPWPGSFSYFRMPVVMTTQSSQIASLISATATASCNFISTINVGVYSLGTGASSESLMSVFTSSGGYTFSLNISITNSTQASYSQGISALLGGVLTSQSTQYSSSTSFYNFSLPFQGSYSSRRFLDIPFATSLSPGAYWLMIGMSSSMNSAGALTDLSKVQIIYSNHYVAAFAQPAASHFPMGGASSSAPYLGAGSFSTAGGGTTAAIGSTAISAAANNSRHWFQLLRSA